jgi:hypothetical protein
MQRWIASAAGGISHLLYPGFATVCSRSRNDSADMTHLHGLPGEIDADVTELVIERQNTLIDRAITNIYQRYFLSN